MLELIGTGLISFWLDLVGVDVKPLDALELLALHSSPALVLAPSADRVGVNTMQQYLQKLATKGLKPANQGIWMQSGLGLLATTVRFPCLLLR